MIDSMSAPKGRVNDHGHRCLYKKIIREEPYCKSQWQVSGVFVAETTDRSSPCGTCSKRQVGIKELNKQRDRKLSSIRERDSLESNEELLNRRLENSSNKVCLRRPKKERHKPLGSITRLRHFSNPMIVLLLILSTYSSLSSLQSSVLGSSELKPHDLANRELVSKQVAEIHHYLSATNQPKPSIQGGSALSLKLTNDNDDADSDDVQAGTTTESAIGSSASKANDLNDNYDSDNSTKIPYENDNSNYNRLASQQGTTRRAQPQVLGAGSALPPTSKPRPVNVIRVSETELLAFSEFTVQQPAFSDLMRSWPPTTLQTTVAAADSANKRMLARQQLRGSQLQQQHHIGNGLTGSTRNPVNRQQQHSLHQQQRQFELDHAQLESFASVLQRNHLNEDFDDTIVTADQSFERDELQEPPTWINYLGEWGDFIYVQLQHYFDKPSAGREPDPIASQQQQQQQQPLKIESIDELLDDYYYDQYENSQVLYYGPQLVREGDIFEIGCFMPNDQPAEWSKSGKPLLDGAKMQVAGSPRVIRRSDFLGAKQNFSLKIFEASLSDSGNYRCNKMSRKYHKLVIVPLKASTAQIYLIQQRLLSVVNPSLMSLQSAGLVGLGSSNLANLAQQAPTAKRPNQPRYNGSGRQTTNRAPQSRPANQLVPGYLIMENKPLVVNCNISDEHVLRLLRENPQFKLRWYKNGRQLRGFYALPASSSQLANTNNNNNPNQATSGPFRLGQAQSRPDSRSRPQLSAGANPSSSAGFTNALTGPQSRFGPPALLGSNQRIQFLQANGRQLYISGAQYSDAGDYSCLWSGLGQFDLEAASGKSNGNNIQEYDSQQGFFVTPSQASSSSSSGNVLGDGSLVQLLAPVKLRPFKSAYHVRQGNQLRLICQAQRAHPQAHISWYVGNRLVDNEFLREHNDEFRIIQSFGQSQGAGQVIVASASPANSDGQQPSGGSTINGNGDQRRIVEINPVPASRQQMQLTANGRGQWIEYRDPRNERYAIESPEQQAKYLQSKLVQLNGFATSPSSSSASSLQQTNLDGQQQNISGPQMGQASISVLVINSLNLDKHTSRYACRATTRANTDEVTTVIRVQAASTVPIRPANGRATLIPGQALHFQCQMLGNKDAEFLWYYRPVDGDIEVLLEPNNDDNIEIHNDRLTISKPTNSWIGDYYCRALKFAGNTSSTDSNEFSVIKVRALPYIEDFGLGTSHTGRSSSLIDGDRLELNCTVRDTRAPVNITWLRSMTPDDERTMVPIVETSPSASSVQAMDPFAPSTFIAPDQNIVVESISAHSKRLIIESVRPEHRSFYVCMADNGITERTRKAIFIRIKDKLNALWPFLGIVAELFILFTIIHVWETQRAYKEITAAPLVAPTGSKRPASGASGAFESVPLTSA